MTVSTRPEAGPAREYHFPAFERRELVNGLRLIVAPIHKLPVVTVMAVVNGGAVPEPNGKEGVASLVAKAMLEGAGGLDADGLADALESLGTAIDVDVDWDAATLEMTVLRDQLPRAFAQFAKVLTAPLFPQAGIDRLKGERIAEILQVANEPRELGDEQFERFLYRRGSRYRLPLGGSKRSVESITRDDVTAYYTDRYTPLATTIIVTGDITGSDAERLVSDALDSWAGHEVSEMNADDMAANDARAIRIVHRVDAPQSELRIGHVGVPRRHPDYFPITVMNSVLGGLFGSRINLNLREAHGYTYGAKSEFDWRRGAGPFVVATAVASNVTAPAISETMLEISRMRHEVISESELSLATNYLEGVFPIRFETSAAVANALASLVTYNLPDEWYDSYRSNIRNVSLADVLRAANTHLDPDRMQFVIVGDASAIQTSVEALKLGPIEVQNGE